MSGIEDLLETETDPNGTEGQTARKDRSHDHPQSNGQVERANQTVQNMMKCICTRLVKIGLTWHALLQAPTARHNMKALDLPQTKWCLVTRP